MGSRSDFGRFDFRKQDKTEAAGKDDASIKGASLSWIGKTHEPWVMTDALHIVSVVVGA